MPRFGGTGDDDAAAVGRPRPRGWTPPSSACRWTSAPRNRAGARFGPRQIRAESALIRPYNMATGAAPFDTLQVADLGDVPINTYSLEKSLPIISDFYDARAGGRLHAADAGRRPHHRAADPARAREASTARWRWCTSTRMPTSTTRCSASASRTARRSAARSKRACSRATRSGRSACAAPATRPTTSTGRARQGFTVVPAHEVWYQSLAPLMAQVRERIGPDQPVYISFDIDGLDPAFAGGTGTPEIGGLTVPQALEIIRGCRGLNLVGARPGRGRAALRPVGQHRPARRPTCSTRCCACCPAYACAEARAGTSDETTGEPHGHEDIPAGHAERRHPAEDRRADQRRMGRRREPLRRRRPGHRRQARRRGQPRRRRDRGRARRPPTRPGRPGAPRPPRSAARS